MKIRHLAAPVLVACLSPMAMAATDGTLGTTSTGTTVVDITLDEQIQVSGLLDINLTYTAGVNSTGNTPLCIYRRNNAAIDLTLSSANEVGTDFNLSDGAATPTLLTYSVALSGDDTVAAVQSSNTNTLANANTTSATCGGSPGHQIDVTVSAGVLDAAQAGTYSDTITILAEPI